MATTSGGSGRKSGDEQKRSKSKDVELTTGERSGLFDCNTQTPPEGYNIDVVAVHGLGGHWLQTWQHDNGQVWLRDFLPEQLRQADIRARVMSFGYNANTTFTKAVGGISDQAMMLLDRLEGRRLRKEEQQRPILFLAHSLGGLIVKKLMILAWERDDIYGDLLEKIRGVVFFAVPHRGADLAFWADFPAKVLKHTSIGFAGNTRFLDALKRDSYERSEIASSFVRRGADLNIRTFYETEKTGNLVVVDQESTRLNVPNERAIGVAESNHQTICKFDRADSQRYEPVWKAVLKMAQDSLVEKSFDKGQASVNSPTPLKFLRLLYTTNYNSHRQRRIPAWAPGTCEWLFQHPHFIRWEQELCHPILWISADPGWGKSVLSSFLVDKLNSADYDSPIPLDTVCYFFFKSEDERHKSPTDAICAILHQLCISNSSLVRHVGKYYEAMGDKFVEDFDTLWKILIECSSDQRFGNVVCILDGLDEGDHVAMRQLYRYLASLQNTADQHRDKQLSHPQSSLRFVLTSRPHMSIEDEFYGLPLLRVKAEDHPDLNNTDIELVIRREAYEFGQRRQVSAQILDGLANNLIKNADKTFLWVALVLRRLKDSARASKASLEKIIRTIPPTLDSVYEQILDETSSPDDMRRILHIAIVAKVPLSLEQVNDAFGLNFTERSYDDLDREPSFQTAIREICVFFIRIIDGKVHFIHQTAKEFLVKVTSSTLAQRIPRWKESLDIVESHEILTRICLFYLQLSDFEEGPLTGHVESAEFSRDESEIVAYLAKYPLLEYAAGYWDSHLRECHEPPDLLKLSYDICDPIARNFFTWFNLSKYTISYQRIHSKSSLIILRCWMGHVKAVSALLEYQTDIDERDDRGFTALHAASIIGNDALASMLLRKGADINAKDALGFTALHLSASYGHEMIAKLLLEADADASLRTLQWEELKHSYSASHCKERLGWTALHLAIRQGNIAVVKFLLDKVVDIELKSSYGLSPLHSAVLVGSVPMAELLLEYGAQIESIDDHSLTPLNMAAQTGSPAIVRLLLRKNASLKSTDLNGRNPLHNALAYGSFFFFSMMFSINFMESGASKTRSRSTLQKFSEKKYGQSYAALSHSDALNRLQIYDRFGWSISQMRAQDNQLEITRLLVDHKIPISSRTLGGSTALHLAATTRNPSIVELLIHSGADVNAKRADGRAAVHTATEAHANDMSVMSPHLGGDSGLAVDVIRVLLDNMASVDERDDKGWTALHCASANKETNAVCLLLSRGADPNVTDSCGRTPLHNLVIRTNPKFTTCEDVGCPYGREDDCGASSDGSESGEDDDSDLQKVRQVMAALLQHGADIDKKDSKGFTALHLAARARDQKMAEILLQHGSEVSVVDKQGRQPLHLAIDTFSKIGTKLFWSEDGEPVVNLLLRHGADINAQDSFGRTPLNIAAAMSSYSIAKFLLQKGAQVNTPDRFGQMPLHSAVRTTQWVVDVDRDRAEIVNLLLRHGADPAIADSNGRTPLDIADSVGLRKSAYELVSQRCCRCDRKTNTKRCTGCRIVRYCSKKCQREDWALHKEECIMVQEAETTISSMREARIRQERSMLHGFKA